MTRSSVFDEVKVIFQDVLDEIEVDLTEDLTANDIEEWDSLTHIEIITQVEKKFELRFGTKDIEELKNIGDIVSLIIAKSAQG